MLGIYVRLSREDEESTSIENQLREGKEFAKLNNYKEIKFFNEGEGISGTLDIEHRPEFKRLLNSVILNELDAVWFRNQNRFERNSLTFHLFLDACRKSDTKIFHADKEFDYNNPYEFLTGSILSTLNAYTAQLQSVQTKKVLLDNIKNGRVHGMIPFGYKNDNGYLAVDSEEAKIVREIYNLHAEGKGTRSIANLLNDKGISTRYGKLDGTLTTYDKNSNKKTVKQKSSIKWSDKSIQDILKNPLYKGLRRWKTKTYSAPAIIDEKLWNKSLKAFKTNINNRGKKVDHKYLLKGLLECQKCGRNMYGKRRKDKSDNFYMCSSKRISNENCGSRSINIDAIESYIWGRLFMEKEVKEKLLKELEDNGTSEKLKKIKADIDNLEKEKYQLKSDKQNAVRLAIKGLLNEADIKPELTKIANKIDDIDLKIDRLREDLNQYHKAKDKQTEIEKDLNNLSDISFSTKKEVIKKYIDRITVAYEKSIYILKIKYNFANNPEYHLIPKDYKIGVILNSRAAYAFKKNVDVKKELNKMYRQIDNYLSDSSNLVKFDV